MRGSQVRTQGLDGLQALARSGAELASLDVSKVGSWAANPNPAVDSAAIDSAAVDSAAEGALNLKVAYLASRFPKITETFILYEMQAVEALGVKVELYSLWRERAELMHDEAREYLERAHFARLLSPRVAAVNLIMLLQRPKSYLRALLEGVRANWGSRRYLLGFLASFPKAVVFARDIEQRGVQHLHAHFASHPAAAAWVIQRLTGIPYSFTAHGSDLHRDQHMLKEKVDEAALVVAISKYNRRLILKHCGAGYEKRVRVIHSGTDTDAFRPRKNGIDGGSRSTTNARSAASGISPPLQIACIGTLHEVKGQVHLIRACQILQDHQLRFRLNLIGDGPDEAMLRAEVARCEIHPVVLFRGRCTRQRLAELLGRMDLVVAPSVPTGDGRREGIPVALMEAMSAGVPVIASALSGIPELVQHGSTGLLVPPGNSAAIAAAIEELAADPDRRHRLATAARRSVQTDFDQRRCAAELVASIGSLHGVDSARAKSDREPASPGGFQP